MANINALWNESTITDGAPVGIAPRDLRALWRALSEGLGESLTLPDGELRAGASRIFVATESASSNADTPATENRLFYASDTSRLFAYRSGQTTLAGSSRLREYQSAPPSGALWFTASGESFVGTADGLYTFVYSPDGISTTSAVAYNGLPNVFLTSSNTNYAPILSTVTSGGCSAYLIPLGGASGVTVRFASTGTVSPL